MNKTKKMRIEKKLRRWWRDERAIRNTGRAHPAPKFGVRPLSILHPEHPARLYGWNDLRAISRDKTRWE